jgi:hypothetical protein
VARPLATADRVAAEAGWATLAVRWAAVAVDWAAVAVDWAAVAVDWAARAVGRGAAARQAIAEVAASAVISVVPGLMKPHNLCCRFTREQCFPVPDCCGLECSLMCNLSWSRHAL